MRQRTISVVIILGVLSAMAGVYLMTWQRQTVRIEAAKQANAAATEQPRKAIAQSVRVPGEANPSPEVLPPDCLRMMTRRCPGRVHARTPMAWRRPDLFPVDPPNDPDSLVLKVGQFTPPKQGP